MFIGLIILYVNLREFFRFYQFTYFAVNLPSGGQCNAKIELMFLVDGSGSIESAGRGNFKRCLNFVKQVASAFVISRTQGRVSVTVFSSKTKVIFHLNAHSNVKQVYRAVDKIRYVINLSGSFLSLLHNQLLGPFQTSNFACAECNSNNYYYYYYY